MQQRTSPDEKEQAGFPVGRQCVPFTLTGLVVFCVALIISSSAIAYKLAAANQPKLSDAFAVDPKDKSALDSRRRVGRTGHPRHRTGTTDRISDRRGQQAGAGNVVFANMKPDDVKALLSRTGLTAAQVAAAFAPEAVRGGNSGTRLCQPRIFCFRSMLQRARNCALRWPDRASICIWIIPIFFRADHRIHLRGRGCIPTTWRC